MSFLQPLFTSLTQAGSQEIPAPNTKRLVLILKMSEFWSLSSGLPPDAAKSRLDAFASPPLQVETFLVLYMYYVS